MPNEKSDLIRDLNDRFRKTGTGGTIVMTSGVRSLEDEIITKITQAVVTYDDFTPDNDPYGEHELGSFEVGDYKLFWKIDYYDLNLEYGSEDPADSEITQRVLTIMLREEY